MEAFYIGFVAAFMYAWGYKDGHQAIEKSAAERQAELQ